MEDKYEAREVFVFGTHSLTLFPIRPRFVCTERDRFIARTDCGCFRSRHPGSQRHYDPRKRITDRRQE